ncbi:transglycosylase SLT domain-containing protein [Couchioplanes caeruleus]|uniref:Lytic transglycosylase n=2 Tax=Couchioplanes caeruleus TaxID=56438 RepID=A0A1K0G315_9ACTN|nr:transglycosylase SLT domain-containing protein [Couchioplanes caeruleus]OJF11682.1 lytic transglycosylase [Couchioplanes caeruleus subsp. caeruleus]ROP31726.1 cell wall-associated NlpC family hydrolase [Couchioplanes caeruleus]
MMGVQGVLSRISELQAQLGVAPTTTGTAAASGASFAGALASATGTTTTTAASGVTGQAVVDAAKKYLGTPYVFGSTNPDKGLDCSALVQRAYKDLGIELPRTSGQQAKVGTKVDSLAQAKPGDILAFNSPVDHVAIYLGDNKMIAAPKPGDQVKIQSVYEKPTHIRRVLGTADANAASAATGAAAIRPASLQNSSSLSGVPYADMFIRAGAKYGVSPKLLAAVAKVESGYNPKAVSPAGAQGLMQLMPGTARGLGVKNSFDPEQAINGAAKLLRNNLKEFKSVELALAAYNAGGGSVHKYGGIPPFAETQKYVPKVQKALAALG